MIGHHSYLRDMMVPSYPIYVCTRANHAHYSSVHIKFCGSSKRTLLKLHVGKKLESAEHIEQYHIKFGANHTI